MNFSDREGFGDRPDIDPLRYQPSTPAHVRIDGAHLALPLASAVAEFGLLLRDDRRNLERREDLSSRLVNLTGPGSMTPERQEFRDLVELARGLARIR